MRDMSREIQMHEYMRIHTIHTYCTTHTREYIPYIHIAQHLQITKHTYTYTYSAKAMRTHKLYCPVNIIKLIKREEPLGINSIFLEFCIGRYQCICFFCVVCVCLSASLSLYTHCSCNGIGTAVKQCHLCAPKKSGVQQDVQLIFNRCSTHVQLALSFCLSRSVSNTLTVPITSILSLSGSLNNSIIVVHILPFVTTLTAVVCANMGRSSKRRKKKTRPKAHTQTHTHTHTNDISSGIGNLQIKSTGGGKKKHKTPKSQIKSLMSHITFLVRPKPTTSREAEETVKSLQADWEVLTKPVNQLIKLQNRGSISPKSPSEADMRLKFDRFRAWIKKYGGAKSGLGESFDFVWGLKEGSGVIALKDMKPGTGRPFMSIHRNLMMLTETAFKSPLGALLSQDSLCQSLPSLVLVLHLWYERFATKEKAPSFFKPYIDVLPTKFSLPIFYTDKELSLLKGSPTMLTILKLKKSTVRQYVYYYNLFKRVRYMSIPEFRYEDFLWAVGVVMSRQNKVPSAKNPADSVSSLIPGMDMCNYADGEMKTFYNPDTDCSESYLMATVKKNDPIYIYYGDRANTQLFLYQGFVYDNNRNDVYKFPVRLSDKDPLFKLKRLLLSKQKLQPKQGFVLHKTGQIPPPLVTYARIVSLTKPEASLYLKNPVNDKKITARNEVEAMTLIHDTLSSLYKDYPTTLAEDVKLLKEAQGTTEVKVTVNAKLVTDSKQQQSTLKSQSQPQHLHKFRVICAIRFRIMEKTFVERCLDTVNKRLKLAQSIRNAKQAVDAQKAKK